MISAFHRAKHWHLFIGMVGLAVVMMFSSMIWMIGQIPTRLEMNRPPDMTGFALIMGVFTMFILFIQMGWLWSIGIGLKERLPDRMKMNHSFFKFTIFFPVFFFLCYLGYFVWMSSVLTRSFESQNPVTVINEFRSIFAGFWIIMLVGFFSLFCLLYNFYFCAKTLKSIELGHPASSDHYIGYFFLFWFNFVGVWIIQPTVNQITSGDWTPPEPLNFEESEPDEPSPNAPAPKEVLPKGEKLRTKNHKAFDHDDDFDGLF